MNPLIQDEAARLLVVTDVQQINQGGQKSVARCKTVSDGPAILKIIELDPSHVDTFERARREVDLLGRVSQRNVVKLLSSLQEIGSPPSAVAWLEEEVDGADLRARFAAGTPWSWDEAHAMALDVARGLAAMHAEKVVHRDLSPANVMQRRDGGYVVIDPGFARHLEESTLTGFFQPGTPGYMTPEHAGGGRVIYASDVFAVGTLVYKALTGELPVPNQGPLDAYLRALRDNQAPSIAVLRPDLSAASVAVVDRCLQRQSGRRYLDAADLTSALESL